VIAIVGVAALAVVDMIRAEPPRRLLRGRLRFRAGVAIHHILQPLVRYWARTRHRNVALRGLGDQEVLPAAVKEVSGGIVVVPEDRPRSDLAAALIAELRRRGIRAMTPSGWEEHDAQLLLSGTVYGELQTSSHPEGFVQVRVRPRPKRRVLAVAAAGAIAAVAFTPFLAVIPAVIAVNYGWGALRARRLPARILPTEQR
jgi:hypothetical protein